MRRALDLGFRTDVRKVKAHKSLEQCVDDDDRRDLRGNDLADSVAKSNVVPLTFNEVEEVGVTQATLERVHHFFVACMQWVFCSR